MNKSFKVTPHMALLENNSIFLNNEHMSLLGYEIYKTGFATRMRDGNVGIHYGETGTLMKKVPIDTFKDVIHAVANNNVN